MESIPTQAPDFRAPSSRAQTLALDSFVGKVPLVVFGIGALDREVLAELDRREVEFGHRRVQLLGLAPATAGELREFAEDAGLEVTLVADPDGAITRDFGLDANDGSRPAAAVVDRAGGMTALFGGIEGPEQFADWLLRAVDELGVTEEPEPLGPDHS